MAGHQRRFLAPDPRRLRIGQRDVLHAVVQQPRSILLGVESITAGPVEEQLVAGHVGLSQPAAGEWDVPHNVRGLPVVAGRRHLNPADRLPVPQLGEQRREVRLARRRVAGVREIGDELQLDPGRRRCGD